MPPEGTGIVNQLAKLVSLNPPILACAGDDVKHSSAGFTKLTSLSRHNRDLLCASWTDYYDRLTNKITGNVHRLNNF
jgi:hypothetical protein